MLRNRKWENSFVMYIIIKLQNGKTRRGILHNISKTHIWINEGEFIPLSKIKFSLQTFMK